MKAFRFDSTKFRSYLSWETLSAADRWLARYGLWLILLLAICYYGQYYRSGLNLAGEGGTEGVLALRLMEGQRPIVDTFLGYNVMWFYPIVWLFQIVGPHYVALRLYFFVICTLGGLISFLVVRRSTGSGGMALLVSCLVILMPGMIFRNYLPFLGVLNMYVLLQAYVFAQPGRLRTWLWMAAAGTVLGLTFLIRIELGIFFSIITLGLAVIYPVGSWAFFRSRGLLALLGIMTAFTMVLATHLPVYLDARNRGFDEAFVGQYRVWLSFLHTGAKSRVVAKPVSPPVAAAIVEAKAELDADKKALQLPALSEAWTLPDFYDRAFIIITYLPIPVSAVILVVYGLLLVVSLFRGSFGDREIYLGILTALGCSLTLYPQFLFFRPDTPHLSEFMVPFLVTLGCALWHALRSIPQVKLKMLKSVFGIIAALCVINAALYTYHTMPKESGGTIAAAKKRNVPFRALNGVDVYLSKKEIDDYQAIFDAVIQNSKPEDYVVCYPYAPTINFMTNRRSYERNLYVDNATSSKKFHADTIGELSKFRPALILIDNRDINKSDSSRFAAWASGTYDYIRKNYRHLGTYRRQEIYARVDDSVQPTHP